ncbi:transcription antitermination factor NusB [Alienimonas californiensis]|uniref:Transcription antitermination protein NusB n=1 Tax=Alienimonas californiensis TaxID=2527989 RepID=A0A517PDH1_9PLAN|nr:transcription antitermination factor NusB [Alienimonas californiensis]QDT17406.1 hypothetical protein CA12_35280 [Alienimonas californiensis]
MPTRRHPDRTAARGVGRAAREIVLQLLFEADLNPALDPLHAKSALEERTEDAELRRRAWRLFAQVMEVRDDLDARLSGVARNWSLKRMAATDRNALRLGLFELLHTDLPPKIVLNEAIELARTYGDKNSPQFVNGLLDRLLPDAKRPEPPAEDAPAAATVDESPAA